MNLTSVTQYLPSMGDVSSVVNSAMEQTSNVLTSDETIVAAALITTALAYGIFATCSKRFAAVDPDSLKDSRVTSPSRSVSKDPETPELPKTPESLKKIQ